MAPLPPTADDLTLTGPLVAVPRANALAAPPADPTPLSLGGVIPQLRLPTQASPPETPPGPPLATAVAEAEPTLPVEAIAVAEALPPTPLVGAGEK